MIRRWLSGRAEMRSLFIAPLAAQHQALRSILNEERFDAVLVDVAFTGALPLLLSDRPRPPVLVCGVVPLTLSSRDTPPFGPGMTPKQHANYDRMTQVVHRILFRGIRIELDTALRSVGARESPVFLTDWPRLADRLLQLTVPSFEYPRSDLPATVTFTGPIVANHAIDRAPMPEWWKELDTTRQVVYVTQGTWDNTDLEQLIGPTLRALAGRDNLLVIATTGGKPLDVVGDIPANARIADYLAYPQLLPHVDVMVTNGGYGGVQSALSYGVPVIVAGDSADKPEVAARVAYSGAGISLATAHPTPAALAAAVDRGLTSPHYRHAAQRLRRDITASKPLDTIADILADLTAC